MALDANDPIVLLSKQFFESAHGHDELIVLAALISTLGAALAYSTQKNGWEPQEIADLQVMLRDMFEQSLEARADVQRES